MGNYEELIPKVIEHDKRCISLSECSEELLSKAGCTCTIPDIPLMVDFFLSTLSPKEQVVIRLRYGIADIGYIE